MFKDEAKRFLETLENHLNRNIPEPSLMRERIEEVVSKAKTAVGEKSEAFREGAFLSHYIGPQIHSYLTDQLAIQPNEACRVFLSESRSLRRRGIASGSPARGQKHPFTKAIGATGKKVIRDWGGPSPLVQACPDMALRAPYKIVIEGKYFRKGGTEAAETALVTGVYECFFYLGLAKLPETKRHSAWDYEYACLLAYDATESASLFNAWKGIREKVEQGFWDGAGIYVMVLRGSA